MVRPVSNLERAAIVVGAAVLLVGAVVSVGVQRWRWRSHWRTSRVSAVSLSRFATAIVGNTRGAVAQVLGPPRIATFSGKAPCKRTIDYRDADVWYYPLPTRAGRTGMAIRFKHQSASSVEFFKAPRNSR